VLYLLRMASNGEFFQIFNCGFQNHNSLLISHKILLQASVLRVYTIFMRALRISVLRSYIKSLDVHIFILEIAFKSPSRFALNVRILKWQKKKKKFRVPS
jgi:hypothetical protein